MRKPKTKFCIRLLRMVFPKAERERLEYRRTLSCVNAHLENLTRTTEDALRQKSSRR